MRHALPLLQWLLGTVSPYPAPVCPILVVKVPTPQSASVSAFGCSPEDTFLVPKPYSSTKQAPVNNTEISRLWRTHFPDAEEKLIHDIGCVKPVIKLLKELTINELIEIHETKQDVEELEALDPVQTEDRMTVGSLTEGLLFIEKELQNLEIIDSNEEIIYFSKTRNEEIISMLQR
ncbi:hypothetical protein TNCV_1914581 [Trichonephila clavipes]|nr:hypothetical protein TNCV_1914581 [Trichonephila clavipes]